MIHNQFPSTALDNLEQGWGSLLTKNRQLYQGSFEAGYRNGYGVLANLLDCNVFTLAYRGVWKNGRMSGMGLRIYSDQSFYLGEWKNGGRHGYGQMWYIDGAFFAGYFIKDKKEGLGIYIQSDGNRYEGNWANNMKNGEGRFFHLNSGQIQDGVWENNTCLQSEIFDIPFRQTAVLHTPFPIPQAEFIVSDDTELEMTYLQRHSPSRDMKTFDAVKSLKSMKSIRSMRSGIPSSVNMIKMMLTK